MGSAPKISVISLKRLSNQVNMTKIPVTLIGSRIYLKKKKFCIMTKFADLQICWIIDGSNIESVKI